MNEEKLSSLLGICCNVTCGCGNPLVKAKGIESYKDWILSCRPFSDKYEHPQQLAIPKNCQLLKDHHMIEQIKKRWEEVNVDIDAPEDNYKICKLIEELLKGCDFCWDPENTTYKYSTCPKCEREL